LPSSVSQRPESEGGKKGQGRVKSGDKKETKGVKDSKAADARKKSGKKEGEHILTKISYQL